PRRCARRPRRSVPSHGTRDRRHPMEARRACHWLGCRASHSPTRLLTDYPVTPAWSAAADRRIYRVYAGQGPSKGGKALARLVVPARTACLTSGATGFGDEAERPTVSGGDSAWIHRAWAMARY